MHTIFIIILFPFYCLSQTWTLDQCIDSAIQNNLGLRSEQIKIQIDKINLSNSKNKAFPSLNTGAIHGYNWGQTIDLFTNQFATNRVQYDNFYLSSSFILFAGLINYYDIKINQKNIESSELKRKIAERNVKIDVSAVYLQILLNREIVQISKTNLDRSLNQLLRIEELIKVNQATNIEKQEVLTQIELDKYNLIKVENDQKKSFLLLKSLLNTPYIESFEISNSLFDSNFVSDSINHNINVGNFPEIQAVRLDIEKQLLYIKSLKGRYFPSISLNGSMGSGYSENNKILLPNGAYTPRPFNEQLNSNFYQSTYFSLFIPIFNKNLNKNQIKIKELELKAMYLNQEDEYHQLSQKFQALSMEIVNLISQLNALHSVYGSALQNYKNYELLFINGSATNFQIEEAKNILLKAESELIQVKYQLIFKELILGYYLE